MNIFIRQTRQRDRQSLHAVNCCNFCHISRWIKFCVKLLVIVANLTIPQASPTFATFYASTLDPTLSRLALFLLSDCIGERLRSSVKSGDATVTHERVSLSRSCTAWKSASRHHAAPRPAVCRSKRPSCQARHHSTCNCDRDTKIRVFWPPWRRKTWPLTLRGPIFSRSHSSCSTIAH